VVRIRQIVENGEQLPGFSALVDYVDDKVSEMTAAVAANPATHAIVTKALTQDVSTNRRFPTCAKFGPSRKLCPWLGLPCRVPTRVPALSPLLASPCLALQLKIRLVGDADGTLAGMTIRDCFHGEAYNPSGNDNVCAISSYALDEANQGTKLADAIKPIVEQAVANIDGGPGAYTAIKDAWDAIPSIPFVFDKSSMGVEWMTM